MLSLIHAGDLKSYSRPQIQYSDNDIRLDLFIPLNISPKVCADKCNLAFNIISRKGLLNTENIEEKILFKSRNPSTMLIKILEYLHSEKNNLLYFDPIYINVLFYVFTLFKSCTYRRKVRIMAQCRQFHCRQKRQ